VYIGGVAILYTESPASYVLKQEPIHTEEPIRRESRIRLFGATGAQLVTICVGVRLRVASCVDRHAIAGRYSQSLKAAPGAPFRVQVTHMCMRHVWFTCREVGWREQGWGIKP